MFGAAKLTAVAAKLTAVVVTAFAVALPTAFAAARIPGVVPDDRIDVGAAGGLAVLLVRTAAALCGGLVTPRRRDA